MEIYPFNKFIKLTKTEPLNRKLINKIASPTADSAAAIVNIIRANIWPNKSSNNTEYTLINKFKDNSNNSIAIKISTTCFLVKKKPNTPKKNKHTKKK